MNSVTSNVSKVMRMLVASTVVALISWPLWSQTSTGRILGVVRDQSGGVVARATVTVTDVARGVTRNLTTDDAGAYLAPNLTPGTYQVRVAFAGFQGWERDNILLEVGQDDVVDAVLQPGAQTQTVTVTEQLPLVNTTSSTLGGTLSNETINDLPINGRNYQNLLELKPGVVLNLGNNASGGGASSTNGMRNESSNEYLVEGLHGMDPYSGMSVINSFQVNGDASTLLPIDAIQEFSTQFNPKAEYGLKPGGTVNVGLKSGTNDIHGTAYAFFRRDSLDARNYFNTVNQPKVNSDVNQFGATVGGKIKRDKLFYFLGYEERLMDIGNANSTPAPFTDPGMLSCTTSGTYACTAIPNSVAGSRTPDASNHFILACLALPAGSRSPQSLSMLGLNPDCSPGPKYPNPNFFVPHGGNDHGATANPAFGITAYFPNTQTTTSELGGLAKVDYHLNDKHNISGFLIKGEGYGPDGATNPNPIWRTDFSTFALMAAGTWTWLPSSRVANAFRFGYASLNLPSIGVDTETGITAAQLGIPTGVTTPSNAGLPAIAVNGFYSLGSRMTEIQGPMTSKEISDQASYLIGLHDLKFGAISILEHQNGAIWASGKGSFTFGQNGNGVPAFIAGENPVPANIIPGLAGSPSGGLQTASLLYGNPNTHISRTALAFYLQDDYRIRPRLTLNLGVRYDLNTVPTDSNHFLGGFDPTQGIVQEGIQIPAIEKGDHNNFSPRLGFAWDVRGNGKTVVRAGGSVIYELITLRTYSEVNNAPALGGNPTSWIIGCSAPVTATIPAGATTNCPGKLLTPGGTRDVGVVSYSASLGTISAVKWDGPATNASTSIFPSAALHNCSPIVQVNDVVNPTSASTGRLGAPCDLNVADPNLRTPYVTTWNLSIEQAIRSNLALDVAYVGNHGTKLLGRTDDNQPVSGPAWLSVIPSGPNAGKTLLDVCNSTKTTATCQASSLSGVSATVYADAIQAARPFGTKFPYIQGIARVWNRDASNYDALQMTLTARNFHRLSVDTGYTFGRALGVGDNNNDGVALEASDPRLQYGPTATDVRHRLTTSAVYAVPDKKVRGGLLEGWRINNIFKIQSGLPWTPTDTRDFQGTGKSGTISRWNLFGDPGNFVTDYTNQNTPGYFVGGATVPTGINPRTGVAFVAADLAINNPLCTAHAASMATLQAFGCWAQGSAVMTPPALNTYGNAVKNPFRGPGYWNLDTSVSKTQKFTERISAEFRAEIFNIFNHPNFGQPGTSLNSCTLSSCTFGKTSTTPDVQAVNPILGSGGQRRVQFGIKLIF